MRYICLWLVFVLAVCGCDNIAPELLPTTLVAANRTDTAVVVPDRPYVRVIYVEPRPRVTLGREARYQEKVAELDTLFREVQTFFADELERHGYPRRTFPILAHADGRVVVERLTLEQELPFYQQRDMVQRIGNELSAWGESQPSDGEFHVVIIDVPYPICGMGAGSVTRGSAWISYDCLRKETLAHELGHAFGLSHDFRNDAYVMSYGTQTEFSRGAAGWLNYQPPFHGRVPMEVHIAQHGLEWGYERVGAGTYQFEFRFYAWFADMQQEWFTSAPEAVVREGFVHGVLKHSAPGTTEVIRYLESDILQGQFWQGGTGPAKNPIIVPFEGLDYQEYTLRFEAEIPGQGDAFILELLQPAGNVMQIGVLK